MNIYKYTVKNAEILKYLNDWGLVFNLKEGENVGFKIAAIS